MNNATSDTNRLTSLFQLAAFARYLLTHQLTPFIHKQLQIGIELNIPLLRFFLAMPEEERFAVSVTTTTEFLTYLAENKAAEQIESSMAMWRQNQLPVIQKESIATDDISLIGYMRKKAMMQFITGYTQDLETVVQVADEIDFFISESAAMATREYIAMLQDRVSDHSYFIQKVAETIPGAVYVFDAKNYTGIYQNNMLNHVIGYSQEELNRLGEAAMATLVHPDDRDKIKEQQAALINTTEGEVRVCKYRIKHKDGKYRWLANYESVFKRDADNQVWQTIGITLNVDSEEQVVEALHQREKQLLEAQDIALLGNFYWDFTGHGSYASAKALELLEGAPDGYESFTRKVLPADLPALEKAFASATATGTYDCEYRLVGKHRIKTLWARGITHFKDGLATGLSGTVMDITEKQTLIQNLRQSESLYKQAERIANMGNWSWDVATDTLEWSDQLYRIYDLEPQAQKMTIQSFLSFVHPADRNRVAGGVELLTMERSMDYTFRIITANGTEKWLRSISQIVSDNEGNQMQVVGTEQDITERQQLTADLEESQNFIKKITDATPSIIALYHVRTGAFTYISEGMQKLLGYEVADAKTQGIAFFLQAIHPDDLSAVIQKNQQALAAANKDDNDKNGVIEFTYRMRHRSGHYCWFHTYGTIFDRNDKGAVEHVLNITLDVTEQTEAAAKIKEQEHFIQQVADASPTILYLFDVATQHFAYINREAFFVLGYLPDELMEEDNDITTHLYHPDDLHLLPGRRQSNKIFQQVDSMIQYECRMKHKDGDYRWMLVREIVFKSNDQGNITQIIGAALDIDRRKDMERTILQNTLQLEQSNASLEEFAYVASHDLKEPLRKISTFGDRLIALHMDKLNDEGKMYLRKIVDASQRMQAMISDLLSISMIRGNNAFEKYSLQRILEETLQTLEFKIEQQKAVLKFDSLPNITMVPSQMRQLFQNLISNSLKFVREEEQPVITIRCTPATDEDLNNVALKPDKPFIKLFFSDNGIGFENEYAQKIFAIFQRLHGRMEYEGSGIGLAICKKIVEHHGGVIFATGEPGKGAAFTIILPA